MTASPPVNLGVRNLARTWRLGVRMLVILAFLAAGGAFSLQLSGLDPRAPVGAESASLRSEIATGLAFAVLLLFGARAWRRALVLLRTNGLLLALPALALASALWAPEPVVALRRASAFAATVLCGFALAAYLPGERTLRFLAQATAAGVGLSILYVAVAPRYGVHQISDGVQSTHAGDWRGLFVHRTVLGQLAALGLAMGVYGGATVFGGGVAVRAGAIGACLLCLIEAHSGGGVVSAAILLIAPPLLRTGQWLYGRGRTIVFVLMIGGALLAALILPPVTAWVLAALGKDATLTGRTDLWGPMARMALDRPLFGYGYSTGFRSLATQIAASQSGLGYAPNAQNGYLDAMLNLGLVGLALTLGVLGLALWRAIRLVCDRRPGYGLKILPLLVTIFIIEMNLVEATLISANDIFVLIFTTALIASGEAPSPQTG